MRLPFFLLPLTVGRAIFQWSQVLRRELPTFSLSITVFCPRMEESFICFMRLGQGPGHVWLGLSFLSFSNLLTLAWVFLLCSHPHVISTPCLVVQTCLQVQLSLSSLLGLSSVFHFSWPGKNFCLVDPNSFFSGWSQGLEWGEGRGVLVEGHLILAPGKPYPPHYIFFLPTIKLTFWSLSVHIHGPSLSWLRTCRGNAQYYFPCLNSQTLS